MQEKKKEVSRVVVVTYTRTRGSDIHFKMRDARTEQTYSADVPTDIAVSVWTYIEF